MKFNPERFLGVIPEQDPRGSVFGFGRRICEYRNFVTPSNERNGGTYLPSRRFLFFLHRSGAQRRANIYMDRLCYVFGSVRHRKIR